MVQCNEVNKTVAAPGPSVAWRRERGRRAALHANHALGTFHPSSPGRRRPPVKVPRPVGELLFRRFSVNLIDFWWAMHCCARASTKKASTNWLLSSLSLRCHVAPLHTIRNGHAEQETGLKQAGGPFGNQREVNFVSIILNFSFYRAF